MIANVSADVLTAFVDNHLGHGETAHTDGWRGYARLGKTGYRHIVSVLSKLDQTAAEVLPRVHMAKRSLRPFPCSILSSIRLDSTSDTLRFATSAIRRPAP